MRECTDEALVQDSPFAVSSFCATQTFGFHISYYFEMYRPASCSFELQFFLSCHCSNVIFSITSMYTISDYMLITAYLPEKIIAGVRIFHKNPVWLHFL